MKTARPKAVWWLPLLILISGPVWAQRQPHTYFKEQIKLSDREIGQIDQGNVVTKNLESSDQYGVLVFGAVYVNATIDEFAEVYRDVEELQEEKVYLAVEQFGEVDSPPKLSDFRRLELEEGDIDELEDCEPGNCDIQVMNIEEFQKRVNWKARDKYAEANSKVRGRLLEAMNLYMKGGLRELGSYRDRKKPLNLYQAMKEMVGASYYLPKDTAGDIYSHVVEYPEGKMAGAEDIFYWEKIDFGQGPVLRVNHVSLFPKGFGAVKFIAANKQLYASKYMRMALQMYYCVPDTQDRGRSGFYLIQMNDSRLPDFGGLKLRVVRKVASMKAVEGTRDTLSIFQRRMEGKNSR